MARKRLDRSMNVSNSQSGASTFTRLRNSDLVAVIPEQNRGVLNASTHKRLRIPTGGRARPEREKPFTSFKLVVNYPSGQLAARQSTTTNLYKGDMGPDSFGSVGGQIRCTMGFPYDSPRYVIPSSTSLPINVDLLSQAEVKCYNKLRDKTDAADLDLGLWYAERRETAGLFRDGAVGLAQLAQAIARKDWGKSARVLKDAFGVRSSPSRERARAKRVERWLRRELGKAPSLSKRVFHTLEDSVLSNNLAIQPLLKDIQGAHQSLLRAAIPSGMVIKAVARHSRLETGKESKASGGAAAWVVEQTISALHGYTVTMVASPLTTEIARLERLGLTNPVATLYQSTRLTFILDYFWSLGQFLSAISVPMGFEFVDGSWTQRIVTNVTSTIVSPLESVAKGRWSLTSTKRTVYGSFPVPIPPLSLRGTDLTAKQATNTGLIALKSLRSLLGLSF